MGYESSKVEYAARNELFAAILDARRAAGYCRHDWMLGGHMVIKA